MILNPTDAAKADAASATATGLRVRLENPDGTPAGRIVLSSILPHGDSTTLSEAADGTLSVVGQAATAMTGPLTASDQFIIERGAAPFTASGTQVMGLVGSVPTLILDTDLASDCDDVGDVAMVAQAVLTGSCKCLAMVAGNLNPNGAAGLKVLLDYALPGHTILVGQYNGGTLNASNTYNGSAYLSQIVARFPGPATTFPNHVAAVRKALAAARSGSVSYVMTGFGSVLADVLASPADTISPLSGVALVKAKVGAVYWAGGIFPATTGTPEPNILADIGAARAVISGLAAIGVPIVFAGDEVAGVATSGAGRIADAPPAGTSPTTSPYEYAFELFGYNAATPRNAWGSVAVWTAIYGAAPLFQFGGAGGTVTINTDGTNAWAATPAAGQSYLARLATPDVASAAFNGAISIVSGNLTVAGGTWGQGAGLPVIAAAVTTPTPTPTAPAVVLPLDAVGVSA